MDSSQDNPWTANLAEREDVGDHFALVPQTVSGEGKEDNTDGNQPNDRSSSSSHVANSLTLVHYSAPQRESSRDVTMSEGSEHGDEMEIDEDESHSYTESESDQDSLSGDETLYEGHGPHADYIRSGMKELRNWMRGESYVPEERELPSVLLSSPPKFQECREACNTIVHELAEQVRSLPNHDHILRVLKDASYPSIDKTVRIGLQGDAAAGKSSLINALLNTPELALTDCGDDACTRFPIEYAAPQPGQAKPITVEIRFFDETTCYKLLKEQLTKYQEETTRSQDEHTEETDDDAEEMDEDTEEVDGELEAGQEAIDFFSAMFMDKHPFTSPTSKHEFLSQPSTDNTCALMHQWLRELFKSKKVDSNTISFGADTPADLNRLLEPYIGSLDDSNDVGNQGVLWPMIESMKVHIASAILESGIVLVDAPGMSDLNEHRVKVAQTSLKSCDYIVVVLNGHGRIHHDLGVKKTIEKVSRRKGSNMLIVVTHNDAKWNSKTKVTAFRKDGILANIKQSKRALKAEKKRIEKTLRKHPTDLGRKRQNLEMRLDLLKWVKIGRKIELSTATTQARVQKEYATKYSGRVLEVHNVSSTWYIDLAGAYDSADGMRPPVKSTGIPQLRESIRKIGEKLQVDRLCKHIHHFLPNTLTNIHLWCAPSHVNILSIATPAIEGSMKDYNATLKNFQNNLSKMARELIIDNVEESMDEWMDESQKALQPYIANRYEGVTINVQTVNAFINKYGNHTPRGKDPVNLNELLMQYMLPKLMVAFQKFMNNAKESIEKVKEDLLHNCENLFQRFESGEISLMLSDKKELLHAKRIAIQGAISTVFQTSTKYLRSDLRDFRSFASETDQNDCIMQLLYPIYDSVKQDFPRTKGYCRARQTAFLNHVRNNQLYTAYLESVEDRSKYVLSEFYNDNIKTGIEPVFHDMHQALTEFCVPPTIPEEDLRRRKILSDTIAAKLSLLKGEISQKLSESQREADTAKTGQKRKRLE